MSRSIEIAGRAIGAEHPPYIIAEMSGNHTGSIERALALIDAAAEAGADAVKLQTYTADTMTIDHDGPGFRLSGGLWHGRTLYDLYREAHTPWEWHAPLFAHAAARHIALFSSPFDETAVTLLEELGAPAYKIASFELVDLPLIERVARTGKPIILSTGLATEAEIDEAVLTARAAGCSDLILLHCTSAYPTPPGEAHLRSIPQLAARHRCPIGLSDHTTAIAVPIAAVALGAVVVEKHFTLAREDGGPDAAFSLEPDELADTVAACRTAWTSLGFSDAGLTAGEAGGRDLRRSLYIVEDVAEGSTLDRHNMRAIRPGHGLAPRHFTTLLGRTAHRPLKRGEPVAWDMVEPIVAPAHGSPR